MRGRTTANTESTYNHRCTVQDYFGGPITRFDIPLLWSSISHFVDYGWHGFNLPGILIAKGLGGCGIHNAMLYVRALSSDVARYQPRFSKLVAMHEFNYFCLVQCKST